MLSDLGLLPSRTEYLPLSVSFWMKIPNKQEVLQDWTQEGPHGYKWIWGLLKVQKMAPFLVKKVNKKKESNRGWGASRGVQEKLGDPGVSYREAKETTDGTEKPHLSHSFQLLPHQTLLAAFLLVENDWSEFYSFFNKDSHVVGKPWTWVGNLRAKSCCDYVSESSCVNLRRCANIQGSRVPYLKSQVSISLDEVINIKVHVTCYINNMGFLP